MTQNHAGEGSPWAYEIHAPGREEAHPVPAAEPPAAAGAAQPAVPGGAAGPGGADPSGAADPSAPGGASAHQPDSPIFGVTRTTAIPPIGAGSEPHEAQAGAPTEPVGRHSTVGPGHVGADGYQDVHYYAHPNADPALANGAASPPAAGPSFANPSYANPSYADPSYADPSYADPSYANPSYADPSYADPSGSDERGTAATGSGPVPAGAYPSGEFGSPFGLPPGPVEPPLGPTYAEPAYDQPDATQPPYDQPSYGQPSLGQPTYGQPTYGQPSYDQPTYGQPTYGQPTYGQPTYGQPAEAPAPASGYGPARSNPPADNQGQYHQNPYPQHNTNPYGQAPVGQNQPGHSAGQPGQNQPSQNQANQNQANQNQANQNQPGPGPRQPGGKGRPEEPPARRGALPTKDQPRPESLLVTSHRAKAPEAAQVGWQGRVRRMSGGLIKPQPSPQEMTERKDAYDIQRTFSRPMTIVVVQPKGGAGKTPATIGLASALGAHRGGYVVGWDDNETRGTLAVRVENPDQQSTTVWDLLRDLPSFERTDARVGDLSHYVRSQGAAQFDALVSDDSPGNMAQIGESEFQRIHTVLQRFYRQIVVDTGNNVRSPNWQAAVNAADQIVVVSTYQRDVGYSGSWVLDHLIETGRAELAASAITVLSAADPRQDATVRSELLQHFGQRTRAVVEIPYDPLIALGGPMEWRRLKPETRRAWTHAGAAVVNALVAQDEAERLATRAAG